jgi:hypothetical protein
MVSADAVLEDEDERQLQQSKMSSTSRSSINEEEDSEIGAGGHHHSEVESEIQHAPQNLHIDLSVPVPYDEQEHDEQEHHPSPLETQNLADEQVSSTMAVEDYHYEDVFEGLDDDDNDAVFEGVDEAPAKSNRDDDGEDQIIGIVIQYDITSDMLREGGIPENASRTKLRSLQKAESYEVCLLDSHMEQHSSSSSDASDEWELAEEHPNEEQVEIVFYGEGEGAEDEEEEEELSFYIEDHQDDVEIRFFNCREDEDTDAGSTTFDDCRSEFAPSLSLDGKIERCWFSDTPPYDWFLPEHTDDVTPFNQNPKDLVIKKDLVNCRSTPTTVQTASLSYEESDHGDHHSLVSHGSAVSEVIQDLVALCRSERLDDF